jgi:hypothetical protein
MLPNCYQYCLIVWCGFSALVEITALFAQAASDSLMEVETHNLLILLRDLLATALFALGGKMLIRWRIV